jgi:hypothetical protein
MPFWNTRVIHTCGAGTSYHSRTHVLAPHVEHVLFPFRTHELVLRVKLPSSREGLTRVFRKGKQYLLHMWD